MNVISFIATPILNEYEKCTVNLIFAITTNDPSGRGIKNTLPW